MLCDHSLSVIRLNAKFEASSLFKWILVALLGFCVKDEPVFMSTDGTKASIDGYMAVINLEYSGDSASLHVVKHVQSFPFAPIVRAVQVCYVSAHDWVCVVSLVVHIDQTAEYIHVFTLET